MAYDDHRKTNELAQVLTQRMKREISSEGALDLVLDFAIVNIDMSITPNHFPKKIERKDYVICQTALSGWKKKYTSETGYGPDGHTHVTEVKLYELAPGDRVLIAWIGNEIVVIDKIVP